MSRRTKGIKEERQKRRDVIKSPQSVENTKKIECILTT